ncbi:MAG: CDP-alcohol phosphatidyltransferase family protein [Chitinivibrionales bacterium]|nr:CDP-alcohol phosphatidyltransferase family protein [Chitinivibrionales bacterium]
MKQASWLAEFKKSLKNPFAEELVDLAVYRPLAFVFVKLLLPLPVTPNQITMLAMIAGITGGILLAAGGRLDFAVGALMYGLANVLDCCDGMIARLKNNGTKTGRIIDGAVDYITSAAAYIGLAIGLSKAVEHGNLHLPVNPWLLVLAAAISTALHAIFSDACRNSFLNQQRPFPPNAEDELHGFRAELNRLNQHKGFTVDKFLIKVYLVYLRIQSGKTPRPVSADSGPVSRVSVMLWNLIGPSTHISFFILAALLYKPAIFFVFVIVAANIWMVLLLVLKTFLNNVAVRRAPL